MRTFLPAILLSTTLFFSVAQATVPQQRLSVFNFYKSVLSASMEHQKKLNKMIDGSLQAQPAVATFAKSLLFMPHTMAAIQDAFSWQELCESNPVFADINETMIPSIKELLTKIKFSPGGSMIEPILKLVLKPRSTKMKGDQGTELADLLRKDTSSVAAIYAGIRAALVRIAQWGTEGEFATAQTHLEALVTVAAISTGLLLEKGIMPSTTLTFYAIQKMLSPDDAFTPMALKFLGVTLTDAQISVLFSGDATALISQDVELDSVLRELVGKSLNAVTIHEEKVVGTDEESSL